MGCTCCCKANPQPFPLQKPGTSLLPPLQLGTMASPDLVLLGLQADAKQQAATIKALEEASAQLHKQVHDFLLSTSSLKSEITSSKKELDGVKSRLMQHKGKLKACEEVRGPDVAVERVVEEYVEKNRGLIEGDLMDLDDIDAKRTKFPQKIISPKEEEKTLEAESKSLYNAWAEAMKDVKRIVDSTMQLQGDMSTQLVHSSRSSTMVGQGVDVLKEEKMEGEAKLLESSALRMVESGQRHMQQIQEDKKKSKVGKEMQAVLDVMSTESEGIRKELEALLQCNLPEITIVEQVVPLQETPVEQEEVVSMEEVEEMQAEVQFEEEVMVAAQPEDDAASWHSSNPADVLDTLPPALTAYEAFDLFDTAIASSESGLLPTACLKAYIAGKDWEEDMYTHWLTSIRQYTKEDYLYAGLILSILQENQEQITTYAALLFPGVIKACNKLVQAFEVDNMAESAVGAEIATSEEVEKMINSGGFMYWTDCLDLIYETFTPEVGTLILKSIKPDTMPLPDYITFQICHKMHRQHTDGIQIFTLLDTDRSGKLNSDEFSKGLLELLSLWMETEDITSTFRSLYNRWSGLVSKMQFSKQVNFEEYIRKTKKEMVSLPKYSLLIAVLEACKSITANAIQKLREMYIDEEKDLKTISDEQILAILQLAGSVTKSPNLNLQLEAWKSQLSLHHPEGPLAAIPFSLAKSTLLAVLCS